MARNEPRALSPNGAERPTSPSTDKLPLFLARPPTSTTQAGLLTLTHPKPQGIPTSRHRLDSSLQKRRAHQFRPLDLRKNPYLCCKPNSTVYAVLSIHTRTARLRDGPRSAGSKCCTRKCQCCNSSRAKSLPAKIPESKLLPARNHVLSIAV